MWDDSREGSVGGDDKVRLGVLVDEAGGGLQVLEAQVLALQPVGNHPTRPRLQHCKYKSLAPRKGTFLKAKKLTTNFCYKKAC